MKKTFTTKIFCVLLLILFFAVQQFSLNAQCPQRYKDKVFQQLQLSPSIEFGDKKVNFDGTISFMAFDMYEPKGDTVTERPLIILIHGGSFSNDPPLTRKSPDIVELSKDLARRGYVVISPEYRLFGGEITFEKMGTTVVAAYIDINDLMCYLSNSYQNGNPYKIDTSKIFMGGSSAGALLPLNFNEFVNDTSEIPESFKSLFYKAVAFDGLDASELIANKFCGLKTKGIISISGPIIDTNAIKPTLTPFLFVHGVKDKAIPYNEGQALGKPVLPNVFGPGKFLSSFERNGIKYEADIYPDAYHVPIIQPFGDSLELAIEQLLKTGSINNEPIMDSTKRHIARFCYEAMGSPVTSCVVTGLKPDVITGALNIYPNPSSGKFLVELPIDTYGQELSLKIYDISGKLVFEKLMNYNGGLIPIDVSIQYKGVYLLNIQLENKGQALIYTDKLLLY
jgi:dienelactone hydrolase